jgi:hypothetical protein
MRTLRAVLMLGGLVVAAYGIRRLLDLGWPNTRPTLRWLVGGVVLHDAVFAPLVLAVALVALRLGAGRSTTRRFLAPVVVVLVVLVPITLAGIPELGRFGARADRPDLLDRDYWLGWWVMATLVVVVVTVGALVRARVGGGGARGSRDGGR